MKSIYIILIIILQSCIAEAQLLGGRKIRCSRSIGYINPVTILGGETDRGTSESIARCVECACIESLVECKLKPGCNLNQLQSHSAPIDTETTRAKPQVTRQSDSTDIQKEKVSIQSTTIFPSTTTTKATTTVKPTEHEAQYRPLFSIKPRGFSKPAESPDYLDGFPTPPIDDAEFERADEDARQLAELTRRIKEGTVQIDESNEDSDQSDDSNDSSDTFEVQNDEIETTTTTTTTRRPFTTRRTPILRQSTSRSVLGRATSRQFTTAAEEVEDEEEQDDEPRLSHVPSKRKPIFGSRIRHADEPHLITQASTVEYWNSYPPLVIIGGVIVLIAFMYFLKSGLVSCFGQKQVKDITAETASPRNNSRQMKTNFQVPDFVWTEG